MGEQLEEETRRLNGNYLRARGEVKDAVRELQEAQRQATVDAEVAAAREVDLLSDIGDLERELEKAREEKRVAEVRLEKAVVKRATAIVESQAERSLREATETSKVFDSVRYDVAFDQQERSDLDRVLDA